MFHVKHCWSIWSAVGWLVAVAATACADEPAEKITYVDHVQPIFREHCFVCHDTDGKSSDLAVDNYAAMIVGGASGEVLAAGAPDDSRLYRMMTHAEQPAMPPEQDKLPEEQLAIIRKWIEGGLLETSSSVAQLPKKSAVASFTPSADNRPTGEPAMPQNVWCEPVLTPETPGAVTAVAASPWAPLVAVAGQRQVVLYQADTRELLGVVPFVEGQPQVVRFSRNGELLLVAGGRGASLGKAALIDVKTGRRLTTLGDEVDTLLAADISPDQSLVAIGGPRKKVRVLRTADGSSAYEISKHTDWVTALEFSPDGKLLVTADRSGNAHLWEAATGRPVADLPGHQGPVNSVSWRGDSQVVVTASDDRSIKSWQRDGTAIKSFDPGVDGVLSVAFTRSGNLLLCGRNRMAKLFGGDGNPIRDLAAMNDLALAIAPTHDEQAAIVGDWTGETRLVALADGAVRGTLAANPPSLATQIELAQAQRAEAATKQTELEVQLVAARDALNKANEQMAAMQQAVATAQTEAKAAREAETQQQAALAAADSQMQAADAAVAKLATEVSTLSTTMQSLQQRLVDLASEVTADDKPADDARAAQLASVETELQQIETQLEQKRTDLATAQSAAQQANQSRAAVDAELTQRKANVVAAAAKLAEAEKALASPPDVAGLTTAMTTAESQLKASEAVTKALDARTAQLQAQQKAIADEPAALATKLAADEAQLAAQQGQVDAAEATVAAQQAEVERLRAALAQAEESFEAARKVASDARMVSDAATAALAETASSVEAAKARLAEREAIEALRARKKP